MSNFEHWIREDSTEFEKAFIKNYDGNMWRAIEKMKYWQPPKQLFEIPKLVADFIEHKRLIDIAKSSVPVSILDWLNEQTGHADFDICVSHLIRIKAVGYTVEKEQMFILKHIDISKLSTDDSLYLAHGIYKKLLHGRFSKDVDMSKVEKCHFTQSEIDKLNIGSYEQIEV